MRYTLNINEVVSIFKEQLAALANPDGLVREVATGLLSEIRVRVHRDGIASNGQPIGTYSPEYMTVRTGSYKNAATFKTGFRAGQQKNAGTTTRGAAAGAKRTRYNLPADTKVIGVLTGQMMNDFKIIDLADGYGLGYTNDENYKKSQYLETTYKKEIWQPTAEESQKVDLIIEAFLDKTFDN